MRSNHSHVQWSLGGLVLFEFKHPQHGLPLVEDLHEPDENLRVQFFDGFDSMSDEFDFVGVFEVRWIFVMVVLTPS